MVDPLGVGLLLTGLVLVVVELAYPGRYVGVAGTIGAVMGLVQMAWSGFLTSPSSAYVGGGVAVLSAAVAFLFYERLAPPVTMPTEIPTPELVGLAGVVRIPIRPHAPTGQVEVEGRCYRAEAEGFVPVETAVRVVRVRGGHVVVEPTTPPPPRSGGPDSLASATPSDGEGSP